MGSVLLFPMNKPITPKVSSMGRYKIWASEQSVFFNFETTILRPEVFYRDEITYGMTIY